MATPAQIEFAKIQEAVDGAGYTLTTLTLELEGEVISGSCATCGEVAMLQVRGTGQLLELRGDIPMGRSLRVEASVSGWTGSHPVLTVQNWYEGGAISAGIPEASQR